MFAGYWGRPDETAEQLLDDGWLRTGDIVTVDETGWVVLVDRIKEVIVSGGFKVYPSQVEDHLRAMPGVADVAVVGIPGGDLGETVVAAVVLEPGAPRGRPRRRPRVGRAAPGALRAARAGSCVLDELPRSQVGKVLRRVGPRVGARRLRLTSRGRATPSGAGARRPSVVSRPWPG